MSTLVIAAIVVGSVFVYVLIAGIIHQLVKDRWDGFGEIVAPYWPLILPVGAVFVVGRFLAVTLPVAIVTRARRPKLPRAEVRR